MRWHTISDIGWYSIGSICLGHNWTVTSDILPKLNRYTEKQRHQSLCYPII